MNRINISDRLQYRHLSKWLKAACCLAFFLISFGALVRAAQAGLSCPDWPLCFGKLIPRFDMEVFLEWFHRLLAGCLVVLVAIIGLRISQSSILRKSLGPQIMAAVGLLAIQVVLGGLTVLKLLDAKTVSAHLLNAILFFTVLLWMTYRVHWMSADPIDAVTYRVPRSFRWLMAGVSAAILGQIAVGGMVSSNFAGMVCPDFPMCHGEWLPPALFPFVIQMTHRALGFLVLGLVAVVSFISSRLTLPPLVRWTLKVTPWLLVIQIGLGVINVLYALPPLASAAHLANATLIYALFALSVITLFEKSASFAKTSVDSREASPLPNVTEGGLA